MQDSDREIARLKELVEENLELSRRNNKILRKLQRSMRAHAIMRVLYMVVIIGSMLGIYYYLQPLFDTISQQYNDLISLPDRIIPEDIVNW